MADDERPDNDAKLKRRAKAPVITLQATEVTPPDAVRPSQDESATTASPPIETSPTPEAVAQPVAEVAAAESAPPTEPAAEVATPASPTAPEIVQKPAVSSIQPQPLPPSPQHGFGRLAAAGLIGALITGGLGYAGSLAGLLPGANRAELAKLESRVTDLDRAVREAGARAQPAPDLSPLTRRIEAVDTARAALEARLATLEGRPADASAAPGTTAAAVDLTPLTREIEALKTALAVVTAAQGRAGDISGAAAATTNAAPAVDLAAVDVRIQSLLAPQTERIGGVETRVQSLGAEIKATAEAGQALATRITALDGARAQANGAGQRAALLVGIEMLRSAVDRGTPYATELRALKALGANTVALQPLEASSERGVAPMPLLARRFTDMAAALVKAAPRPTDGGLFDRLAANAQSLIRIRPVGEAAGDDTPVVVGRIEAKLNRADLAGALADFDRLPETAKAVAKDWERDARARLSGEAALKRMADEAIGALATR